LIGLNYRLLDQTKKKKPTTVPASFSSSSLVGIKQFLEKTKLDFQDLENAYTGIDSSHSINDSDLFKKLTRDDTKFMLGALHPIISGITSMPYFTGNGKRQSDYYFIDLAYKSLIYHALMLILPGYEVEADPTKPNMLPRLSMVDLVDLFDDTNDAVFELGLSFSDDPASTSALQRMQTINLFTRTGNGDDYMDVIETTDFLVTTIGGKKLLDEVRRGLTKDCYPQNQLYTTQDHFSYACLKSAFFSKEKFKAYFQKIAPDMIANYESLSDDDQETYRKSTLTAVKAGWSEDSEMKLTGIETLVSIPYYVEDIFLRLDHNYNGVLTFTEAMSGFPIFCGAIKKAAGPSVTGSCIPGEDPRQVEAIYGHLLMKGTTPRAIKPGDSLWQKIVAAKDFLVWAYEWKHLDKTPEVRDAAPPYLYRKDLLNIISNLSTSIVPPALPDQPVANVSFE
jgi:hypothetical protein